MCYRRPTFSCSLAPFTVRNTSSVKIRGALSPPHLRPFVCNVQFEAVLCAPSSTARPMSTSAFSRTIAQWVQCVHLLSILLKKRNQISTLHSNRHRSEIWCHFNRPACMQPPQSAPTKKLNVNPCFPSHKRTPIHKMGSGILTLTPTPNPDPDPDC